MNVLKALLFIPDRVLGLVLGVTLFPLRAVIITAVHFVSEFGPAALELALSPINLVLESLKAGSLFGFIAAIVIGAFSLAVGLVVAAIVLPFVLVAFAFFSAFNIINSVFEGISVGLRGGIVGVFSVLFSSGPSLNANQLASIDHNIQNLSNNNIEPFNNNSYANISTLTLNPNTNQNSQTQLSFVEPTSSSSVSLFDQSIANTFNADFDRRFEQNRQEFERNFNNLSSSGF